MSTTAISRSQLTWGEVAAMMREAYGERLLSKVALDGADCWEWLAARDACGYGRFGVKGKNKLAHRVVYELFLGDVEKGFTIDHLCRNRGCVNPAHMEALPLRDNIMRGTGVGVQNAHKTHCVQGHLFDEQNTGYKKNGARFCRECGRLATWRWRNRST